MKAVDQVNQGDLSPQNKTILRVRYAETDAMKYAWHGNFFVWFEVARTDLLKSAGMSYRQMEEMGVMLPLLECGCKFKIAARYDDELEIKTAVENLTPARITFKYEVFRTEDGKLMAEGMTSHAFMNDSYKAINLKKVKPEIYKLLGHKVGDGS